MDRATGKMVGIDGSAISSMTGQLKMQHVKCILRATSDGWQACMHGIRSRRRAVTDLRWTLCLSLLTPSEHE